MNGTARCWRKSARTVSYIRSGIPNPCGESLVSSTFTDWIELSSSNSLTEAQMPEQWIGRSLSELRVREKYGVTVVGVRQGKEVDVTWDPHEPLPAEGF